MATSLSSDNPGGAMVAQRPGFAARASAGLEWWADLKNRESENTMGIQMADSVDGHHRPPNWIEHKDRTILGYPVMPSDRDENYWEVRYAKELYIGEERFEKKKQKFQLEQHDVVGTIYQIAKAVGIDVGEKTNKQLTEDAEKAYEAKMRQVRTDEKKKQLDWNAFVTALESDKPLLTVAKDYRNVVDCYGIDECLDNTLGMLWLAFKIGGLVGIAQGGFRSVRALHVDAAFLKATGVGVLTFANVSIFAGFAKWAGNLTVACGMFLLGDRMVREAKRYTLPEQVEPLRTPINYSVGLAGSFGVVGIMPWWILNDKAMGIRLGASSAIVGAAFGYAIGLGMQQLIALNLGRLDYTPSQFRAYQALMKRERTNVEDELQRMRRLQRAQTDQGLVPA